MMSPIKRRNKNETLPHFEPLEDRVLLTTVEGGEFFIYLNSQGEAVRVDVNVGADEASTDASIELLAYDSSWGGITDLPGIRGGDPTDSVSWDDGSGITEGIIKATASSTGITYAWQNYTKASGTTPAKRGAETEIYGIYVAKSTANTVITISTLTSAAIPAKASDWADWYNDINTWSSSTIPILEVYSDASAVSPTGSGGVLIGGYRSGTTDLPVRHLAAGDDALETGGRIIGNFPGGNLPAGITFASNLDFEALMDLDLGRDVQSVAVNSGDVYAVNLGAFEGEIINNDAAGDIGNDVSSLASNSAASGTFYAVDNDPDASTNSPTDTNMGSNVTGIAADDSGVFYAVDEITHHLVSWNGTTYTDIGELIDTSQSQFRYENVSALGYNSATSKLYAIANVVDINTSTPPAAPDPEGPFLIEINTSTGAVVSRLLIGSGSDTYTALAFNASGACYAVRSETDGDVLVTVNTTTGAVSDVAVLKDGVTALTGFVAIDYLGDTLYGVTNETVYRIIPGTGACTSLGASGLSEDMTSLTYDPSRPGALYTTVNDTENGGYRLSRIPLGPSLISIDTDGVATTVALLVDSSEDTWVWDNITGLDYRDSNDQLYAVAEMKDLDPIDASTPTAGRRLVSIDPTTGVVTDIGAITTATDIDSLAFNTAGTALYGVDGANDNYYSINIATGACTLVTALSVSNIVGIELMTVGTNDVLYAVTANSIYAINTLTGAGSLLGDTGQTTLSSLAFDSSQPTALWSTANDGGYRLTQISLYSSLVHSNGVDTVTQVGVLTDASEPAYSYSSVYALEHDGTTLYAIGTVTNVDPVNVAAPSTDPYLISINTSTGAVTQVVALVAGTGVTDLNLASLSYDSANDVWYGVETDATNGDRLVTVNITTGVVTSVGTLTASEIALKSITGLDFEDGTLYATSGQSLYSVSEATAAAKLVRIYSPALPATMSSLSGDDSATGQFWSTVLIEGNYYLTKKSVRPTIDVSKIFIGGTLAGSLICEGNVDVINMGFLWGQVDVTHNLNTLIMRNGGGAVYVGGSVADFLSPDGWDGTYDATGSPTAVESNVSRVTVSGTLGGVYTRSDKLFSAIQTEGDFTITNPTTSITELEKSVIADSYDSSWRDGDLVDFTNDTKETAQFLSHPTGDFTLTGELVATHDTTSDWYALPLLAGQTVTIDGILSDCVLKMYDSHGNYVDSYGYESSEDYGVGSRGTTLEALSFTAPEAGIYYLLLDDTGTSFPGGTYALTFTNATAASLGAVSVVGDYNDREGDTAKTALRGTGAARSSNIATKNAGNLGAVMITGTSYSTDVYAIGGGNLIAFEAGQLGEADGSTLYGSNTIFSDSNIGRVASTTGQFDGTISAGNSGGYYNNDAYIQNIYAATDYIYGNDISATGSIGVIEVEGNMGFGGSIYGSIDITINSDNTNPFPGTGSRLDLIDVGGNFSALGDISHGFGDDIGYIHVGGTIYVDYGSWNGPLQATEVSDGSSSTLNDDGGGQLVITPTTTPVLDANGLPTYDAYYNPIVTIPTYSYTVIPINGSQGGVLANLTIDGSVTLNSTGVAQISNLELTGTDSTVTLNGSGTADIYYVTGGQVESLTTKGDIVSGKFTGINNLSVDGDVGPQVSTTGAWVHGWEDAPTSSDIDSEAQYGWFHGKINGLNLSGDLGTANIDGSLRDLRVAGTIGRLTVNADKVTAYSDWDGIDGVVWSGTRIDYVNVGDGLADDGSADIAEAAILSTHSIGEVRIDGPYHTVDGIVYGQLNGAIIGGSNDLLTTTTVDRYLNTVTTTTQVDAINKVIGRNGASLTALVLAMNLDSFQASMSSFLSTGGINEVNFSGSTANVTAEINGSEIAALYVRKVTAGTGSNGIANTYISGNFPPDNDYAVGQVTAAGPGMSNVHISVNGGSIGTVKTLGSVGDIIGSTFTSTDGMHYLRARDITRTGIYMPGKVKTLYSDRNLANSTVKVGAIDAVTVKGDFSGNTFYIANELSSMKVDGAFSNSYLYLQGPSTGYLKKLEVAGNIGGTITAAGKIGSIVSKTGAISADISTTTNTWSGDVNLIQAAGGYTGDLDVAGTLKKFVSGTHLGTDPQVATTQVFDIIGDLDDLRVGGNLFAGINVGGDVGKVDIDGTFYSNMYVNGDINSFTVDGGLGGTLGALGTKGSLNVQGNIKKFKFNTSSDLAADLSVGGTIKKISLKSGSITGNLTSRYGSIGNISLSSGSITGDVQAVSIGKISVKSGNVSGDITTTGGGLKSFDVRGNFSGDMTVQNGRIDKIYITGSTTDGKTIEAEGGIGKMTVNGTLSSDVLSHQDIKTLTVKTNITNAVINAEMGIGKMKVSGAVTGSTIRSGSEIKNAEVVGAVTNSIISSAWNIDKLKIRGAVTSSHILSGYDVGADGAIGGGDDATHSGDIGKLDIYGQLNGSVVAAGINPGDGDFTTLGDNTDISGDSSIIKTKITGGVAGGSVILADTYIDPKAPAGAVVTPTNTAAAVTGTAFGPETAANALTVGGLTLKLTGAGVANYNSATNHLVLNRTTSKSKLTLTNVGANVTVTITGAEDARLSSLTTKGTVTLGDVNLYGKIKKIKVPTVSTGATWNLIGGVTSSATVGALTNVDVTAGEIGKWKMGAFSDGAGASTLTADSFKSFYSSGAVAADITSQLGEAKKITVKGDLSGDVTSQGTIKTLKVTGALSGVIDVTNGDLLTMKVTGAFSGRAESVYGMSKSVTIGGAFSGSYRTSEGISKFTSGAFSGLLSTDGDIKTLTTKGAMTGQARAGGMIKSAKFASMSGALVTAGGDFQKAKITGNMVSSQLFAGFDPGDAGYDSVTAETGNLEIDAFSATGYPTTNQVDSVLGGSIKTVTVGGAMTDSTISAAVGPGEDGYCGTSDDIVAGAGYITKKVKVGGAIFGSGNSCGVFAASGIPLVYHWSKRPFTANGGATVGTMQSAAGLLTVTDVTMSYNAITVFFNHAVNFATVGTESDATKPDSFTVLLSEDTTYDPATDIVVSETVANTLTYDSSNYSVTFTLSSGLTWVTLPTTEDAYYQITLDGSIITDTRGFLLDGEYGGSFSSGDGEAGGDFVYYFQVGEVLLSNVPGYDWWHGCSPTAAGMLIGYYDNTLDSEFVGGIGDTTDANDQANNADINEMIASSGDGVYVGNGDVTTAGTPGTGHIPDYALYDGYNDYSDTVPYDDLSTINPASAHADDCLADFMLTSRSAEGLTMGGSWQTNIGTGIENYVEYLYTSGNMTTEYTATVEDQTWGIFTWATLVGEITAGRPVMLLVDVGGTGSINHSVLAVGYDTESHAYACHNTWIADDPATTVDESLVWYTFSGVAPGQDFGIGGATTVTVAAA